MQESLDELIQCHNCSAKVYGRVWSIHQVMCNRHHKSSNSLSKKEESGPMSRVKNFFEQQGEEEGEGEGEEEGEEGPLIPCLECGESFPFSAYAVHELQCIGHQLTLCRQCNIKFPTFLYEEHVVVCEGNPIQDEEEEHNELLNALVSNLVSREENSQQGLTKQELANLRAHVWRKIEDCPICCTPIRKQTRNIELNCRHVFHANCVNAWLTKNPLCPMCRTHALHK